MSDAVATTAGPLPANLKAPADIARTPFFFESGGQALFAWLHRPQQPGRYGVVLCNALGHEHIHAYRTMRHWADALARAGVAVLRFDYFGTGDSAGVDESPRLYETWLNNIRDAVAWLRNCVHVEQIGLWGFRLGATLAMKVAAELPVDSLVLWAHVLKGRQYLREMKALNLTAELKPQPLPEAPDDLEAAGFVMTRALADDLAQLDAMQLQPQCRRALILARDDAPTDTRLLDHLKSLGIHTQQIPAAGYVEMLAEPHHTRVPFQALADSVRWLQAEPLLPAEYPVDESAWPTHALLPHQQYTHEPILAGRSIRESVYYPDAERRLFAILSEPVTGAKPGLPTLLFCNGGSTHHVGPSRLYVLLARHLAACGFRCVRLDLAGLGDSSALDPATENDTYPETGFADIDAFFKSLNKGQDVLPPLSPVLPSHPHPLSPGVPVERGAGFVLLGLCSGAYYAFQSAAQFRDPALIESIPINPLTYYWKNGMTLDAPADVEISRIHYYLHSALQPGKWFRFLTGQSKIGLGGAFQILWRRLRISKDASSAQSTAVPEAIPGHPARDDLPGDLDRIAASGRKLTCFFARSDPGSSILLLRAGKKVDQMVREGKMEIHYLDNADHTFSTRVPRRRFIETITAYLCRRYPCDPAS